MAFSSFFANPPAPSSSSNVNPNAGGLFALTPNTNAVQNNTSTTSTTSPSTFGSTNPAPNPLQSQPTLTSLFGNTNTNTNTNQNTTTNTGGSLFGQQQQQPSSTGESIFGNTNNNPTTTTGSSFFANAPAQGSLFGGPTPAASSTSTGGGGTGAGIFGTNTTNTNSNTNAGGIFGLNTTTNINTSNQQQPGTTGSSTGNSLFGGSTTAAKPTGTSFFNLNPTSNNAVTNTNTNTNSLFGGSFLGQPSQQQNQPSQQPQQSSLFSSRPNALALTTGVGTGTTGQQQQQLLESQEQFIKITQGVETVYNAWNPNSKDCRFQYIFYNLVDPKHVNMYGRPQNATNDVLWDKAIRENPDPTCLVPVVAIGFDDLRERANAQSTQSSSHLQKLTELSNRLKTLLTEHSISNASRLQRAHNTQTQLTQRLMRLVQHLHLLIPAVRSSSIRVEEEELRSRLEEMEEELKRGRVKGKLNEMWALLGAVGAFMARGRGDGQGGPGDWAVVDEEGLTQITQILAEQQAGLQHLTKILQKNQKDLAIIMGSGTAGGDDGYLANEGENMLVNSSLRSSRLR